MENKQKENAFLEQCRKGNAKINDREKALLWPILAALGVERKKWEKFKYFPDQLSGLIIACIKERDREIASLRKKNHDLKKTLSEFKQQNFDFRRCPIPTMRKL